jgi:hypothetical protein
MARLEDKAAAVQNTTAYQLFYAGRIERVKSRSMLRMQGQLSTAQLPLLGSITAAALVCPLERRRGFGLKVPGLPSTS